MIARLVAEARRGVDQRRSRTSLAELREKIGRGDVERGRPFCEALARPGLSVVAEFKRRSPSAGQMAPADASVAETAVAYERGGAAALSVLTNDAYFGGSLADLRSAHAASGLPILRKDFIVDRFQLYEAAAYGADAVLLISRILDERELHELHREAAELDLDVIVEVHDAQDLEAALLVDAQVIGINNRDLERQRVDLATTFELMPCVPAGKTVVAESGISASTELEELDRVGVDAVLVGETLMRQRDREQAVRDLLPT